MEGMFALKTGKLTSFSEQQLIDCDDFDSGCDSGWGDLAFTYAEDNKIESEADY